MFSKRIRLLVLAVSPGMLIACNTLNPVSGSVDPSFGEAVKYDMAIQTIDPEPVYAEDGAQPGDSGVKGSEAAKRYRTGAVKDVQVMQTTGGSSGPQ